MVEEKEKKDEALQPVVKRTNPKGIIAAFITLAFFLGILFGYIGGYAVGRASVDSDFRGGSMMQRGDQNMQWRGYGPGMQSDEDDGSSSTDSSSST